MRSDDTTVVLVHGAWAVGSSWGSVIASLKAQGIKAVAAPMPLTSLADNVRQLVEQLRGSMPLSCWSVTPMRVQCDRGNALRKNQGAVYVAALAPGEGETVADVFYRGEPHPKAPKLGPDENALTWLPEDAFADAFAQNALPETQGVLAAVQRPIAIPCITTPVGVPSWRSLPSWYLLAEDDRMIVAETQRFMAERTKPACGRIRSIIRQASQRPPLSSTSSTKQYVTSVDSNRKGRLGMNEQRIATDRLAAFSDAVMAVTITIMVLELKAPDDANFPSLLPLWPTAIGYAAGYLFIAIIWINHHHLLRFVRHATPRLIWINFAHLFVVSLLPFATAWMTRSQSAAAPVTVYAAIFLLVDTAYLVFEREIMAQTDSSMMPDRARLLARRRSPVALAIFAVAPLTSPFIPLLGCGLICCALVLYVRRRHSAGSLPDGSIYNLA
ncbi:alpha/beta fold hydrolase [Rhizobium sp. 2YAF20]|uniref:TMEM175 family protein n=1 Tax=Rhizobium sp. 2YAF20 TaxID=3233027 RepID=UPI003F96147E